MKVEYINPFIASVVEALETMLDCDARRGETRVVKAGEQHKDVTGLIGLSGAARGTVALSFPNRTALQVVSRLLGEPASEADDETVCDGVAELVNIVAGGAKSYFCRKGGTPIEVSLPTVIKGNNYTVSHPTGTVWLEVPFDCALGSFSLQVTFDNNGEQTRKQQ
jgi:chemotaxis protein CheX